MTPATLEDEIKEAIPGLFAMAKSLTRNNLSENYKVILTEIKDTDENLYEKTKKRKKENDKKLPVTLSALMPTLLVLYNNLYDINLHIYKATKKCTIIDIRYYPKSSLTPEYRQTVLQKPPMLHCKVLHPMWLSDKKEKFDINWEHYEGLNQLRLWRLIIKLRLRYFFQTK